VLPRDAPAVQKQALNVIASERLTITIGGFFLSIVGGWVNSITLGSVIYSSSAFQSGNVARISAGLFGLPCDWDGTKCGSQDSNTWEERWQLTYPVLCLLSGFFMGAMTSGILISGENDKFRLGKGYGFVLLLESALLVCGGVTLGASGTDQKALSVLGASILAFACGLQNALATTWSGATLRTTHITGVLTDLGSLIGSWLRVKIRGEKHHIPIWKLSILVPLFVGFLIGSMLGILVLDYVGYWSIAVPAFLVACLGGAYLINHTVKENKARLDSYTSETVRPTIIPTVNVQTSPILRVDSPRLISTLSLQIETRVRQIEMELAEGNVDVLPMSPLTPMPTSLSMDGLDSVTEYAP
jgi:uncharacterized membrane protein YoaK (UPF0700 family)